MRRGLAPRSLKSASWRRKSKFSASTDRLGRIASTAEPTRSASNRITIRATAITPPSRQGRAWNRQPKAPDPIIADHRSRNTRITWNVSQTDTHAISSDRGGSCQYGTRHAQAPGRPCKSGEAARPSTSTRSSSVRRRPLCRDTRRSVQPGFVTHPADRVSFVTSEAGCYSLV